APSIRNPLCRRRCTTRRSRSGQPTVHHARHRVPPHTTRRPRPPRDRNGSAKGQAMVRRIVAARELLAMIVAAGVGVWGLHAHPVQTDDPFLGLIAIEKPLVFHVLAYGYATL